MHIIMDIGCLECMVPTNLVATFSSKVAADAVCAALDRKRRGERATDHSFEVFAVPGDLGAPNTFHIQPDYREQVDACGVAYREL